MKLHSQVSKKGLLLGKVKGKEKNPKSEVVGVSFLSSVACTENLPLLPKFVLSFGHKSPEADLLSLSFLWRS